MENIYNAGVEIVKGVLGEWNCTFKAGIKPTNYIGDIFGSLGGEPDFGPGSITGGEGVLPGGATGDLEKRGPVRAAADKEKKKRALQRPALRARTPRMRV